MDEVKLAFVAEALNTYMIEVIDAMKERIRKYDTIDTRTLMNSLRYNVYQRAALGNANLNFAEWGRFLDMGVGRGHPLGGAKATQQAIAAKKKQKRKKNKANKKEPKGRKPKKIYSPIVYGHLNKLIGTIAYGFTEDTIKRIKQNIQTPV